MKETRIDDGLQNYKNRIIFGLHKIEVFNRNSNFNIKSHKEDDKTKGRKIETCTYARLCGIGDQTRSMVDVMSARVSVDKYSIRPLFAAMAILSIFVAGSLLTGAPSVNAQEADPLTTDERLENIETLLFELINNLSNITNHVYELNDEIHDIRVDINENIDSLSSILDVMKEEMIDKDLWDMYMRHIDDEFDDIDKALNRQVQYTIGSFAAVCGLFAVCFAAFMKYGIKE